MMNFWKKIKALFTKSEVEKTSLQKTARISIIFAAVALVGVIVYFAVIAPLLNQTNDYVPELFEGEVYQYSSIYILPIYERSEIKSVEIKNSLEHYKLNRYTKEDKTLSYQIENSEHIVINEETLSALLADVRVLITNYIPGQERVNVTATEQDLKNYGLDEASDPAWFEVVLDDGNSYRIYIGKALATSSGYYARLEGRKNVVTDENGNTTEYDIVYALTSALSETVLSTSNKLVTADMTPYIGNTIYSANDLTLTRMINGERKVIIRVGMTEDLTSAVNTSTYQMLYPKAYVIHEDIYTGQVLTNLAYVQAYEIVAYGNKVHDPEVYEAFGMDLDSKRLDDFTDNNYAVLTFNCADINDKDYESKASILYFSEKKTDIDETEFYYVYSPLYEIVGKVSAETYGFIDWQLAKFTSPYLFYEYLTNTEVIDIYSEIKGLEVDSRFVISGKERSMHVDVVKASNGEIIYDKSANGEKTPLVFDAQYKIVGNTGVDYYGKFETRFRTLFYVLLTREFDLYENEENEKLIVAEKPIAHISVTTSPKDHPLTYYKYDENGQREGAALRDQGGNILCTKVVVPSAIEGGDPIVYENAFYDVEAGRFFLKAEDPNDGFKKPLEYKDNGNGTVKVTKYLPVEAYGEYVEKTYRYDFYYLEYVDENSGNVPQLNSTRMYVVPTITETTYKLTSDGQKEVISAETNTAEEGVYIRTTTINKLFSDAKKLLNEEDIDDKGVN